MGIFYHEAPCWTITGLVLLKKILVVQAGAEHMVYRLTLQLHNGLHLE